ncbi:PREDICTED: metalloendoproteinase 5-MMP-like [Ipomoea nil]|uniref:metalloendoproteinase 5-MMP-like n=1 Tax=Ipomoea nil TaxID=35883 RepID=UPI0009015EFB|nr:PREDICTED: metalloendoproteinase 5-MMP-like [Ipomoea nil]
MAMVPKLFPLVLYALLFLSLQVAIGEIPSSSSSPFSFIKPLQGSKKGDEVKGLYELKIYLKRFGYINNLPYNNTSPEANYFSDQLESAVRTFQANFNLNSTGVLDSNTVSLMMKPRCGVPDIIGRRHRLVPQYSFLPGNPRWPDDKNALSYAWGDGTPYEFVTSTKEALQQWSGWTRLSFNDQTDYNNADLKYHLFAGEHGDGQAFDGPGGIIAHSFQPTEGICHLDSEESWAQVGPYYPYGVDIQSVVTHETGHLLGLGHSGVEAAVMYPYIGFGETKRVLDNDDIQGIKALYP